MTPTAAISRARLDELRLGGATRALVGASPVMRQLFTLIDQLAASDVSILIEGETGVGKELVAEEIHRRSVRSDRPFAVFDCAAVPDELVLDADGGTVFLDEVGELAPDVQPALIRVLDRRVGRPIDVRLIAASRRDLLERIDQGTFRDDLYYRLAVVRVVVPPLRERKEDIPLLVRHFLAGRDFIVDDPTLARLVAHPWPGNVRELRNVIDRAIALSGGKPELEIGELPARTCATSADMIATSFREAKAVAIESFERNYLGELVGRFPSLAAAATAAGMDRKHLRVLLRRYGLRET